MSEKQNCQQLGILLDPENRVCPVLDVDAVDTTASVWGRKKETTQVIRALGGEKLGQMFEDGVETFEYEAQAGDAIFVNSPTDQYVPPYKNGRLKIEDLEEAGFEIASHSEDLEQFQVASPKSRLLVGVVDTRICIKGAWGDPSNSANHQFLSPGATLKVNDEGAITSGIDKKGFEKWMVIPPVRKNTNVPKVEK